MSNILNTLTVLMALHGHQPLNIDIPKNGQPVEINQDIEEKSLISNREEKTINITKQERLDNLKIVNQYFQKNPQDKNQKFLYLFITKDKSGQDTFYLDSKNSRENLTNENTYSLINTHDGSLTIISEKRISIKNGVSGRAQVHGNDIVLNISESNSHFNQYGLPNISSKQETVILNKTHPKIITNLGTYTLIPDNK